MIGVVLWRWMCRRSFAIGVEEGDAKLNNAQAIDVDAEGLVMVVGFAMELALWTEHDARKLGILSHVSSCSLTCDAKSKI